MTADPFEDQFEAAAKEAHELFKKANGNIETLEREGGPDTMGGRIGERFQESLDAPGARACPHIANQGPQPIFGAAALPGLIGCLDCMRPLVTAKHLMERIAGEGRTCDSCGDKATQWHDGLIQRGPLLLHVNICRFCMQMTEMDYDAPE